MPSVQRKIVDMIWMPTPDEYRRFMCTMYPDECGQTLPVGIDNMPPDNLTMTVPVGLSAGMHSELMWFATASGLTISEVMRRFLEHDVRDFGEFQIPDD